MFAELIVDLSDLGGSISKASGQSVTALPKLTSLARLWRQLGIEVSAMHIVAPDFVARGEETQDFESLNAKAWWKSEQVFLDVESFEVRLLHYPPVAGQVACDALVVTTALERSDALQDHAGDHLVIVMSNRSHASPAVTHASGVPVMIAGNTITDPGLAHVRLDDDWLRNLEGRHSTMEIDGVELRDGRPWNGNEAIATPYGGLEGRQNTDWSVSSFAHSIAIFDPTAFSLRGANPNDPGVVPNPPALAKTIQRLGLGEMVHIETIDPGEHDVDTSAVAKLYRYAADYPDAAIIVASARDSLIAATSDLTTYSITNPARILRMCVLHRNITFDESVYANDRSACRVVLEQSQSELLFDQDMSLLFADGETEAERVQPGALTLVGNPNTIRQDAVEWRRESNRRYLMLGSNGETAVPADSREDQPLPISLGGCSDFVARAPRLRPGLIVEGVRSNDGERWLIVSDPIERRRARRSEDTPDVEDEGNNPGIQAA